jgi:hypothetical protein
MNERLKLYRSGDPEIVTRCNSSGRWRFHLAFRYTVDGKEHLDIVMGSTDRYDTESEAIEVAKFCICTAWNVTQVVTDLVH